MPTGYSSDYFKPHSMSQGSLVWILQVFFVEKNLFFSRKLPFLKILSTLYCSYLFINFSALEIYEVLKSYWWEKNLKKLLNFDFLEKLSQNRLFFPCRKTGLKTARGHWDTQDDEYCYFLVVRIWKPHIKKIIFELSPIQKKLDNI